MLLTFNDKLRSISIQRHDSSVSIEKAEASTIREGVQLVEIQESLSDEKTQTRYVASTTSGTNTAAVELAKTENSYSVVTRTDRARLFLAFPLTATRDFCLPVVLNNQQFEPREERDTIVLSPTRDGKTANMNLFEDGCALAALMVVLAGSEGWDQASELCYLNPMLNWDWVDDEWVKEVIATRFLNPIRASPMIRSAAGKMITASEGMLPVADDLPLCLEMWRLARALSGNAERLPNQREVQQWSMNLRSWSEFLGEDLEEMPESLTLTKFCKSISELRTLSELEARLVEGSDVVEWLSLLYGLMAKIDHTGLFEQLQLIPDQTGDLRKITELRRDPGIDDELKNIADILDLPIRRELLDLRVGLTAFPDFPDTTEKDVLSRVLQVLREASDLDAEKTRDVRALVLSWLVRHGEFDLLNGLPVTTKASGQEGVELTTLSNDPNKADERLLSPSMFWPEPVQSIANLFPARSILADEYATHLPSASLWSNVAEHNYIRTTPLYSTRRRQIPFLPDEPLATSDKDKKHATDDAVEVMALAFLERDGAGLDAVRKSKSRAIQLFTFLANYVLDAEPRSLDINEALCNCEATHRYYRAAWLAPLWERKWVPLGDSKQSVATAESIAQLFTNREAELQQLTSGNGRSLLEALGISVAELSLRAVAPDENVRISLIDSLTSIVQAASNDPDAVRLVADELKHSPSLIDDIREHRERREQIHRNQSLGETVEKLLKQALEEYQLKVSRTGVGSDYEIEEDFIGEDGEILLSLENDHRRFLVEVKGVTSDSAKMTVTQARTAVDNQDNFMLCVVRVDPEELTIEAVKNNCRFIPDIGQQIEPVWKKFKHFENAKDAVDSIGGNVGLLVMGSQVRFTVSTEAAQEGLTLEETVHYILQKS